MKNILAILRSQSSFRGKSLSHLLTKKDPFEKSESKCLANLGCFQGTKGDTHTRDLERKQHHN